MHRQFFAITLFLFSSFGIAGDVGNQFVRAKLAYGASVSIPRSWQVMRGNEMRAVETIVGAAIDLSGYARVVEGTEALLVSNFPDPRLYAGVTITSTSTPGITPTLPLSLSDAQVRSGEATIRQGMEATLAQLGSKVWGWTRLRNVTLGGTTVMHISYLRSSDAGERKVHIYKFFGSGRVYDVALSTSVAHETINSVVLEKIANSFVAP